jgi:hypothetical protein
LEEGRAVFRLYGLPQDAYQIGLRDPYGILWLPPTYRFEDAGDLEVSGIGLEEFECTIPSAGHLRGYLRGSWLEMALPPPKFVRTGLQLFWPDSTRVLYTRPDTTTGWFSLPIYAPMPGARLRITYSPIMRWHGGPTFDQAEAFDLEPGKNVDVDLVERGIQVQFPGVRYYGVTLQDSVGQELFRIYSWRETYPDYDMYFSEILPIPNLVAGTYYLYFWRRSSDWAAHWYRAALTFDEATPIVLGEDDIFVHIVVDSVPPP